MNHAIYYLCIKKGVKYGNTLSDISIAIGKYFH